MRMEMSTARAHLYRHGRGAGVSGMRHSRSASRASRAANPNGNAGRAVASSGRTTSVSPSITRMTLARIVWARSVLSSRLRLPVSTGQSFDSRTAVAISIEAVRELLGQVPRIPGELDLALLVDAEKTLGSLRERQDLKHECAERCGLRLRPARPSDRRGKGGSPTPPERRNVLGERVIVACALDEAELDAAPRPG